MKVTNRDFARKAQEAARACRIFYFCGPDEAGAWAGAAAIASLLGDIGEKIEINGSDLRQDPRRLGDEARSSSLFGDARHIIVRASGDDCFNALENHIDGANNACPVFIIAANATDKSRCAKLLEKRDDALVAMFYIPELRDVAQNIRRIGEAAGLRLSADIAEQLARTTGLDIRLAQMEIEKLATFLDAAPERPSTLDQETLDALVAKNEDDQFMPFVNVVLSGQVRKLHEELRRMDETGMNPVGLLLSLERRAAQLAQIAGRAGARGNVTAIIQAEVQARRIFFKEQGELTTQARIWHGHKLDRLIARLMTAHNDLMENSGDAAALLAHELTQIAHAASRQARQNSARLS